MAARSAGRPPAWFPEAARAPYALQTEAARLPLRELVAFFGVAADLGLGERAWLWTRSPRELFGSGLPLPGACAGRFFHRPWQHFAVLSQRYGFRLAWPHPLPGGGFALEAEHLGSAQLWPPAQAAQAKYAGQDYADFNKLEQPEIYCELLEALDRLALPGGAHILSLGVFDGDEWQALLELARPAAQRNSWQFFGLDLSRPALRRARQRFPGARFRLLQADMQTADRLGLPAADALLCLSSLQSRDVDRDTVLRGLKRLLKPRCDVLFALPHCHLSASGLVLEPLRRHTGRRDRSLALKDARYLARFLFRAGFQQVEVFGSAYLYVWGSRKVRGSE